MSQSILHFSRMEWPADWEAIFGRSAPIFLEIGFGSGSFLIDWARKSREKNVIGIEISLPSLRKAAKKMGRENLSNLSIIQGDSLSILWLLFNPNSISEVVINFPDPWPKARHHHRRLISTRFLNLLASRVLLGGVLDIATDHQDYAAAIEECLEDSPFFDNRLQIPFLTADADRLQTKYEKKALSEGRICHYYKYRRNNKIARNTFPIPEVGIVPHVVINGSIQLETVGELFEPFQINTGNISVKYLEVFQSAKENLLLLEFYLNEDYFNQRLCLAIRSRRKGDIVVSIHPVGFPRPTPGLHQAIYYFVDWLQTTFPGMAVVSSTLNITDDPNKIDAE